MDTIEHRTQENCFVFSKDEGQAILSYSLSMTPRNTTAIDFTRTYVPPAFRGQGVAEQLVRAGIKWAKAQGYELHSSCWYAAKFID